MSTEAQRIAYATQFKHGDGEHAPVWPRVSSRVARIFTGVQELTIPEKLLLAKLLLESVLNRTPDDEADWMAMSLSAFQQGLDNEDDAIYDNWRELYNVQAR